MNNVNLEALSQQPTNKRRRSTFVDGKPPRVRHGFTKPYFISTSEVYNRLSVPKRIAKNATLLIAGFYRVKHPEAKDLFTQYCHTVIEHQHALLLEQHTEFTKIMAKIEEQGYSFTSQGEESKVQVYLDNDIMPRIMEMVVCVDEVISMLDKMLLVGVIDERTKTTHQKAALNSVNYIDQALIKILKRLDNEFKFSPSKRPKKGSKAPEHDFVKINAFLSALTLEMSGNDASQASDKDNEDNETVKHDNDDKVIATKDEQSQTTKAKSKENDKEVVKTKAKRRKTTKAEENEQEMEDVEGDEATKLESNTEAAS